MTEGLGQLKNLKILKLDLSECADSFSKHEVPARLKDAFEGLTSLQEFHLVVSLPVSHKQAFIELLEALQELHNINTLNLKLFATANDPYTKAVFEPYIDHSTLLESIEDMVLHLSKLHTLCMSFESCIIRNPDKFKEIPSHIKGLKVGLENCVIESF
jgi:hypothetical protein